MGQKEKGFTLVELLVVVAIIGLLASIAIPAMQNAVDKSKQKATMGDMRQIGQGLSLYEVDFSYYPSDGTAVSAIVVMLKPFLHTVLRHEDHWRHDYQYTTDGFYLFTIESFGRDGIDGIDITPATALEFELDLVYATSGFSSAPI